MRFLQSDLLVAVAHEPFDAIVSNPPYIADGEPLERQVAEWEPHGALFAGPRGLEVYERLLPAARAALAPGGWLALELGYGQASALRKLLAAGSWQAPSFLDDLQRIPRVCIVQP